MSQIPSLTAKKLIKAFVSAGFEKEEGTKHTLLIKQNSPILTVPRHKGDLAKGLVLQLIKDSGMTRDEFLDLL